MEWAEVINNPLLQNLPFKIELNKWGKILMSPASNNHGRWQFKVGKLLDEKKGSGEVITECSINTPEGVKVADVAWVSDEFIEQHGFDTPYHSAPEICVEIVSPSNSAAEMYEKIALYLAQGAKEVWLCDQDGKISYFSADGKIASSEQV
ncbi:Uma2 family endonuclease [Leucothrix pacifica]|uniref:Uma2 family endonuclease n=1 Tax=Leucothrix pacifica TaxID=1247513 RepID=A0A317CDM8_9GAMM|nr:Uma2 family endonuclease [Leucothrix pacifica]PWQ95443.1 Uma2 family endonuclease [Leucothrix pacifica]